MPLLEIQRGFPFKLHYELHGQGPLKMLFIMGLGISLHGWEYQIEYFGLQNKDKYTILVFDNRGTGLSDTVQQRATTFQFARDASDLLDHVGWNEKVNLIGISLGGMISLELALLRPATTLVSTNAGRVIAPFKGSFGILKSFFLPAHKRKQVLSEILFPTKFLESRASDSFSPIYIEKKSLYTKRDEFHESFERRLRKTRATTRLGFLVQLSAVATHYVSRDRLSILKDSGIQILVTTGTADHVVDPSNSYYLSRELNCQLHVFQDAGHVLPFQERDKFNLMLEEHINGLGITSEE